MEYEQPALFQLFGSLLFVAEEVNDDYQSPYGGYTERDIDQGVANAFMASVNPEEGWPARPPQQRRPVDNAEHWQPQSAERMEAMHGYMAEMRQALADIRRAREN